MIRRGPRPAARPIRKSRVPTGSFREDGWRALIAPGRVTGLVLMLATAGAMGWLVTSDQFAVGGNPIKGPIEVLGLNYTDFEAVLDAIDLTSPNGSNAFAVRTNEIRRRILDLPSVADAVVHVVLPNSLEVAVTERTAVLVVARPGATYPIDAAGVVLEARAANAPTLLQYPYIYDQRGDLGIAYEVGQKIDPTELAAMLQIGALTPTLVGSNALSLQFSADDTDGFVVSPGPGSWRAVFGFYTPTLRPPTEIAKQVQCLRSLLATGESTIGTIYLAPADDRCGTYLPRPS